MNFSFLNPLFWFGALALAVPIYLHLRRKQPKNLLPFSTIRFLEDQPQPKQSPLRLRDLILFALRALALLLLVGAFAWPFIREATTVVVKESRVYILDNSLSHQVEEGFQNDRERLVKELGKTGWETQIAVVELTASPRVVVNFGDEHAAAIEKIRQLHPSFQRGSYLAAFRQANTLLANSLGQKKKIILLGDNQENQWADNLNTPPFLDDVAVEIPKTKTTERANISVSDARAERIFLGEKSLVHFTAQLVHKGKLRSAKILLRVNGQELLAREIDLADKSENIIFQTEWEAEPTLQLSGELSVQADGDSLAGDNAAFFSLAPVREGKVAVLAQSKFLKLALSPEVMRGHWSAKFIEPTKIADELAANNDAEVLCIEASYLQSSDARRLLSRYLSNGRGVFLMVNRVNPATRGFLRELGFEILPGDSAKSGAAHFQYIFANHPVFHPFTSPDYGNLLEIKIINPVRLRGSQAMPLIFSDKGEPVFFQTLKSNGKMFVSAFGFDRAQTSWPVHTTFIPFLDLCLQNARPADATPTSFEPGDAFAQNFSTNSTVKALALFKGEKELARGTVKNGNAQLRLPDSPGLYRLVCEGGTEPEKIISINPSPKESQLIYASEPQALESWQLPASAKSSPAIQAKTANAATFANIRQQRIWWWLLLVALVGLFLETLWTNLKRRPA